MTPLIIINVPAVVVLLFLYVIFKIHFRFHVSSLNEWFESFAKIAHANNTQDTCGCSKCNAEKD